MGRSTLAAEEFAELFDAYFQGVQLRGKANIGEKTFLDGLYPAIESLKEGVKNNMPDKMLAKTALESAKQGVQNTKNMIALHGRAATRGENSKILLDLGAYVAQLVIAGYSLLIQNHK